jgi:Transglycosylase-like domain
MVFFVAAGVLFYQLALSTNYSTVAQTAADAAALAAEQNVVQQEQSAPGFLISQGCPSGPPDQSGPWQAASQYAQADGATVISVQYAPNNAGYGCDAIVLVKTSQGLPANSVAAGKQAIAEARASTDPLSAASAPLPISNDASTATGPRFVGPHGGKYGFFPSPNTNFSQGSEPEIAGRLDQLGIKQKLHIVGLAGYTVSRGAGAGATYVSSSVGTAGAGVGVTLGAAGTSLSSAGAGLQACGAAALVSGLGPAVSSQQVTSAGLALLPAARPGQTQEVGLSGTTASSCDQGTAPTPSPQSAGNADVHLVPLEGGPKGSVLAWPGLGLSAIAGPWVIPTPVVMCESSGIDQPPNWATASGYYQITLPTWQDFGGTAYAPAAYLAPKPIQDLIAARIWNSPNGPRRWDCARMLGYAA